MSLSKITMITAAASAVVVLMTGGTFAKTFDALYSVNVHATDSKKAKVIDTLYEGERVSVTSCDDNDWCFVTHSGPDGWVPMAALERASFGGGATIVFGGGDIDFPHQPMPPVVVDPGPKHPIVGGLIHTPPLTLDPGSSQGNGGGSGGMGGGNGTHPGGICIIGHTCASQP